jgi:hypothetical protein
MHRYLGIAVAALWLLATGGNSIAQSNRDAEAVRAANKSYYAALSSRDIRRNRRMT